MKKLQEEIGLYLTERGWDKLRPSDLCKSINIEASELLEIFQWSNPTLEETRKDTDKVKQIKTELADVLIYCLDLATLLGIDSEKIIKEKLEKIKKKYPANIVKNIGDKEPGTDEGYLTIKKSYRRSGLS